LGKLDIALRRAKERHERQATLDRQKRRSTDTIRVSESGPNLWESLASVELDSECMAEHHITLGLQNPGDAEMAYNMLRTRLIRRMQENNWSSIIVTSPNTNAGKSVTAVNLAVSIARVHNQNAYLIDLDLREPSLHRFLGVLPPADLTDYLNERHELPDVLVEAGIPRLYFCFNTIRHQHSAELLSSPRMRQFVDELKQKDPQGLVIYDVPPLLEADDALAFCPQADTIMLVTAEGETLRKDLEKSIQMLGDINLLGVVLNKSHSIQQRSVYY